MKNYKDKNNQLWAYEEDGSQDHLIGDKVFITEEEAEEIRKQQIKKANDDYLATLNYKERRLLEYPSIGDQLDYLYHAGIFPKELADKIKDVKDKFPKTN